MSISNRIANGESRAILRYLCFARSAEWHFIKFFSGVCFAPPHFPPSLATLIKCLFFFFFCHCPRSRTLDYFCPSAGRRFNAFKSICYYWLVLARRHRRRRCVSLQIDIFTTPFYLRVLLRLFVRRFAHFTFHFLVIVNRKIRSGRN